jgi:hypothetical protein
MVLPVQTDLTTMDYPSRGGSYIDVPAKSGIITQTMDYPSRGIPLVTNDDFSSGTVVSSPMRMMMGMGF